MAYDAQPSGSETTDGNQGLSPYAACPRGTPGACAFGDAIVRQGDASVHRCGACGHGVTRPSMPDVRVLYEGRASQDYQGKDGRLARAIKQMVFDRQARALVRQLPKDIDTAYDFGCGSGAFTGALATHLPGRTIGLDFFDAPPPGLGADAYRSFEQAESLGPADLVTLFHVLEHDDDPLSLLRRAGRLLRAGGTLVVEVPNMDAVGGRVLGAAWDNWYLPYHRTHFSAESLTALLERDGYHVRAVEPVCVPSLGRSAARLLGQTNRLPFLLGGAALHPLQQIAETVTKRPTALRVIATSA